MNGFVKDIESLAVKNDDFRQVVYTAKHCQLVVMSLNSKEEIGEEMILRFRGREKPLIYTGCGTRA